MNFESLIGQEITLVWGGGCGENLSEVLQESSRTHQPLANIRQEMIPEAMRLRPPSTQPHAWKVI